MIVLIKITNHGFLNPLKVATLEISLTNIFLLAAGLAEQMSYLTERKFILISLPDIEEMPRKEIYFRIE